MQASDFGKDAPGRLVKTVEDRWAFVPAPLPPPLHFDGPLVKALAAADLTDVAQKARAEVA